MRRLIPTSILLFACLASCSSDGGGAAPADPTDLAVSCTDSKDSVYGDPGASLPADKGAIIKCSKGDVWSKEELADKAKAVDSQATGFTSGVKMYRVLYRTERGTATPTPGYSSAMLFVPRTPRAAKVPLVLVGRGSQGQAPKCAPSRNEPEASYVRPDYEASVYPLVGAGFAVIVTDLPGYANFGAANNPISGYANANDAGKAMLDASRAARKLIPNLLTDDVFIVGHSQGGLVALDALALSESYGLSGTIRGTYLYAPLWLAQRSWGALLFLADQYTIKASPAVNVASLWYHYTTAELLDGPGKGQELFVPEKRAAVKAWVDTACWAASYPELEKLGTTLKDLYDPAFQSAITMPAAMGSDCSADEPAKSLCEKWMARYAADRPTLPKSAASIPMHVFYGNKDTTIPPDRITCAIDKIKSDGLSPSICVDPQGTHSSIVRTHASWVATSIANIALGETAPAACANVGAESILKGDEPATCNPIPPNK